MGWLDQFAQRHPLLDREVSDLEQKARYMSDVELQRSCEFHALQPMGCERSVYWAERRRRAEVAALRP